MRDRSVGRRGPRSCVKPSFVKPRFSPGIGSRPAWPSLWRRAIASSRCCARRALVMRPITSRLSASLKAPLSRILKNMKSSKSFCRPIGTSPWMSSRSNIGTSNKPGPIHCKAPAAAAKSQRPAAAGVASTRLARAEEELAVRASVADQEVPGRPDPGLPHCASSPPSS